MKPTYGELRRVRRQAKTLARENAILLAMAARIFNRYRSSGIPAINSPQFQRELARFINGPEFTHLKIRTSEAMNVICKASGVALDTRMRIQSRSR